MCDLATPSTNVGFLGKGGSLDEADGKLETTMFLPVEMSKTKSESKNLSRAVRLSGTRQERLRREGEDEGGRQHIESPAY